MTVKRLSCYNRAPFPKTTTIQDGWFWVTLDSRLGPVQVRVPNMVRIPFAFDDGCVQWTANGLGSLELCQGCKWLPDDKKPLESVSSG